MKKVILIFLPLIVLGTLLVSDSYKRYIPAPKKECVTVYSTIANQNLCYEELHKNIQTDHAEAFLSQFNAFKEEPKDIKYIDIEDKNTEIRSYYKIQESKIKPNSGAVADSMLLQLSLASIAFSIPESTNVDNSFVVQLLIDLTKNEEHLVSMLEEKGKKFSAGVPVSKIVMVELKSDGFVVEKISPIKQPLSSTEPTEWLWNLKPKVTGMHTVFLAITAIVTVDGEKETRLLETFQKEVIVEVAALQLTERWLEDNWQWVWSSLLVPVAVWSVSTIRKKRR